MDKFHYIYNGYDVLDARRKGQDPQLFLQTFLDDYHQVTDTFITGWFTHYA